MLHISKFTGKNVCVSDAVQRGRMNSPAPRSSDRSPADFPQNGNQRAEEKWRKEPRERTENGGRRKIWLSIYPQARSSPMDPRGSESMARGGGRGDAQPSSMKTESPKSATLIAASSSGPASSKFSGLRSRWITPMKWQTLTTLTISRQTAAAAFSE